MFVDAVFTRSLLRRRVLACFAAQVMAALAMQPPDLVIDARYGSTARIMALPQSALLALLRDPDATTMAKAKACQRLATVGDKAAVPVLAPLLADPQLSSYARFALEPNPDPSANDALRAALDKVQGKLLAGVIASLGFRKDAHSLDTLARFRTHPDPDVARAATIAMERIRAAH